MSSPPLTYPLATPLLNSDAKRHPLQCVAILEDSAELIASLLSDALKSISGQIMRPNGGLFSLRFFE